MLFVKSFNSSAIHSHSELSKPFNRSLSLCLSVSLCGRVVDHWLFVCCPIINRWLSVRDLNECVKKSKPKKNKQKERRTIENYWQIHVQTNTKIEPPYIKPFAILLTIQTLLRTKSNKSTLFLFPFDRERAYWIPSTCIIDIFENNEINICQSAQTIQLSGQYSIVIFNRFRMDSGEE